MTELVLPPVPVGDPLVDEAYQDLTALGFVLFEAGIVTAAHNLVPNAPVDIPGWAREMLRMPAAQSQRSGPLIMSPLQAAIARLWATKRRVTFLKPPRFGSTLIMVVGLIYHAGHLGVDVLFYERTQGDAQDFHDKKLYPILLESPDVAHLIRPDTRSGVQDAWSDRILTTGASIQLRSVTTNGSMRGIKGLFIGVDEPSSKEYQEGTTGEKGEGSKLALILKRAQEFFDPIVYVAGTPTVVGACLTSEEWEKGDQSLFMMRSPCCPDEPQEFHDDIQQVEGRHVRLGKGLRYTCDEVTGRPDDAWYECAHCGGAIEETSKVDMMETGVLVPQNPKPSDPDHASIWAWAAYSTDPQSTWLHIARDDVAQRKDPEQRQPFMNLTRARPWKVEGVGTLDPHKLSERAEDLAGFVPDAALGLYKGIDTQEGGRNGLPRHEIYTVAYGPGEESWILDRTVIDGVEGVTADGEVVQEQIEPFSPDAARAVWTALDREWRKADGTVVKTEMVAVDVGYDMNRALAFCHHRESRRRKVVPVKGRRESHGSRLPVITRRPSVSKSGFEFQPLGTQSAKDTIFRRLGYRPGAAESVHFSSTLPMEVYEQLTAETLHVDEKGRTWWDVLKPGTSNEALDCIVYAYAALCLHKAKSRRVREAVAIRLEAPASAPTSSAEPVALNEPRPPSSPADGGARAVASVPARPGVRVLSGVRTITPDAVVEAVPAKRRRYGAIGSGARGG